MARLTKFWKANYPKNWFLLFSPSILRHKIFYAWHNLAQNEHKILVYFQHNRSKWPGWPHFRDLHVNLYRAYESRRKMYVAFEVDSFDFRNSISNIEFSRCFSLIVQKCPQPNEARSVLSRVRYGLQYATNTTCLDSCILGKPTR